MALFELVIKSRRAGDPYRHVITSLECGSVEFAKKAFARTKAGAEINLNHGDYKVVVEEAKNSDVCTG